MIAGQNPGYIVKALEAYKSGERVHPSMRAIAATLSGQDMADLAVYYATVAK
jgi:cytochrome c553